MGVIKESVTKEELALSISVAFIEYRNFLVDDLEKFDSKMDKDHSDLVFLLAIRANMASLRLQNLRKRSGCQNGKKAAKYMTKEDVEDLLMFTECDALHTIAKHFMPNKVIEMASNLKYNWLVTILTVAKGMEHLSKTIDIKKAPMFTITELVNKWLDDELNSDDFKRYQNSDLAKKVKDSLAKQREVNNNGSS